MRQEEPAWRRVTAAKDLEYRWPATVTVLVAVGIQLLLPETVTPQVRWVLPALELAFLVVLVASDPVRISRRTIVARRAGLALAAVVGVANAWSVVLLVRAIVTGTSGDAPTLLLSGAGVWLTNVIAFALVFWELDRGGPAARAHGEQDLPDFLFAQMQSPDLAPRDWEPHFVDYLFLAFTNATAFSPTDVLPMSRRAKLTMMLQSTVALAVTGFVVARAVNVLS
ncbi:hypothetical protein [Pseudonocardia xishanensis]|uniref:DUF1345 domain-containing protein n=1 Tax=Pseudonocardia xishanensis TaxID=630995 RepID=A0ABP8RQX4_9PSEU